MIEKVSLWHVIPVHIGKEFFDPTISLLEANEELYKIVNNESSIVSRQKYSQYDYDAILRMKTFLRNVKNYLKIGSKIQFCFDFPNINGCISKIEITPTLFCYIMYTGIAVFLEFGDNIEYENEKYFSIPVFHERQRYEDDYCINKECSNQKKPIYDFLEILWKSMDKYNKDFSSSKLFRNNGISYALCLTMIDIPDFDSKNIDDSLLKNINSLLDTTPFTNIYNINQWNVIKNHIDEYTTINPRIQQLSETLIIADNWSGVVVCGDLNKNFTSISWLMEFEIVLQSRWLLFDAYCENVLRQDNSIIELQSMLNKVEFIKVNLDNDISSNMEQSRHTLRNALIDSSDINVIYHRMHGVLENKLKLQTMNLEKSKSKFALLSDIALLVIAILQVYGVILEFITADSISRTEIIAIVIMLSITTICGWFMIKGRS